MALLKELKARARKQAERLVQGQTGQRILANPDVQKAIEWTAAASRKVRDGVSDVGREVRRQLSLPARDDLERLKQRLDELSEERSGD